MATGGDSQNIRRRRGSGEDKRTDEIIKLAAKGLNNVEIAELLGIKPGTVKTYWDRIYKDSQRNSQASAVAFYIEKELQKRIQELEEENAQLKASASAKLATLSKLLADANNKLAGRESDSENWSHVDLALRINCAAVYELNSLTPPTYKYFSPSGTSFGLDVSSLFHTYDSILNLAHPDDLLLIIQKSAGATYLPNERYVFIFRFGLPEPRWILDSHQAVYNEHGEITGITGVIIDIHHLVVEGVLPSRVERIVVTTH